jgi:hypothetical protein
MQRQPAEGDLHVPRGPLVEAVFLIQREAQEAEEAEVKLLRLGHIENPKDRHGLQRWKRHGGFFYPPLNPLLRSRQTKSLEGTTGAH